MSVSEEMEFVERLRKRAEIRRQIQSRKSVQEGKPDRIAELLERAADEIETGHGLYMNVQEVISFCERYRYEQIPAEIRQKLMKAARIYRGEDVG